MNIPLQADGSRRVDDPSTELSSNRTAMSLERTKLSGDRTLMAVIRTSLSLITFGFTIYQFFNAVAVQPFVANGDPARNFGLTLILLGIAALSLGIANHYALVRRLRRRRDRLLLLGFLRDTDIQPVTMIAVIAVLLLLIGIAAIASIAFRTGPFS